MIPFLLSPIYLFIYIIIKSLHDPTLYIFFIYSNIWLWNHIWNHLLISIYFFHRNLQTNIYKILELLKRKILWNSKMLYFIHIVADDIYLSLMYIHKYIAIYLSLHELLIFSELIVNLIQYLIYLFIFTMDLKTHIYNDSL